MKTQVENQNRFGEVLRIAADKGKFSGDLKNSVNSKQIAVKTKTHYLRKDITNKAGIVDLLTANEQELTGFSTFSENRLPTMAAFLADRISLLYGTGTDSVAEMALDTKFPKAFASADIVIKVDNNEILKLPAQDFFVGGSNTKPMERALELAQPLIMGDNKILHIQLHVPDGVSITAATGEKAVMGIFFHGGETVSK